jgi:hypothetical protein
MTIVIHNLHSNSEKVYQGDKHSISRQLDDDFPWIATMYGPEDLRDALDYIDSQQNFTVEVLDDSLHPFVGDKYEQR